MKDLNIFIEILKFIVASMLISFGNDLMNSKDFFLARIIFIIVGFIIATQVFKFIDALKDLFENEN